MDTLKFQRGTVLVLSTGEYSDYRVDAILVTLTDCDLRGLAQAYHEECMGVIAAAGNADWDRPQPQDFPSWLVAKGHAMPVDHNEIYLGAYGEFAQEFEIPEDKSDG